MLLLQLEILQQTLKQKTNVPSLLKQLLQSDNSHTHNVSTSMQTVKSSLNAIKNSAAFDNQGITTVDLSKDDNIDVLKLIVSESQTLNKNKTDILEQLNVTMPQKSTLDASNNNHLEENTVDTNDTSVMNIKITNVTSLSPEVFESVPNICNNTLHESIAGMRQTANKMLAQITTHGSSVKRSVHEGKLTK